MSTINVGKSITNRRGAKPTKPYADFPLTAHPNGQWSKKIRGKVYYFGPWGDWQAALKLFQEQRDDLMAGRTPRVNRDEGLTVKALVNRFLAAKKSQRDTSEISNRSYLDYHSTCARILDCFGKTRLVDDLASDDFERLRAHLAATRGPVTLGNEIQRVRVVFKYGYDAGLIEQPMRYGPTFKRPSKKTLRIERNKKGPRMFSASELQQILGAAPRDLRAMVLLGVNCGFGNHDCGTLSIDALDLQGGWVNFPRPKTGIQRRCWLWPETVEAIRESIVNRAEPKDERHARTVFLTRCRVGWSADDTSNPISAEMAKLLKRLKIHRAGLGFYALRHTFETVAGESRDQVAVNAVMGHVDNSMAAVYRERISDERLRAVAEHVRNWLFPSPTANPERE